MNPESIKYDLVYCGLILATQAGVQVGNSLCCRNPRYGNVCWRRCGRRLDFGRERLLPEFRDSQSIQIRVQRSFPPALGKSRISSGSFKLNEKKPGLCSQGKSLCLRTKETTVSGHLRLEVPRPARRGFQIQSDAHPC
jgi:hypothetical protein